MIFSSTIPISVSHATTGSSTSSTFPLLQSVQHQPQITNKNTSGLTFVSLSAGILLRLEKLLINENLIVLPHHLSLQDLSVFDQAFEFLDDKYRLSGDGDVTEKSDDRVRISDQLE